MGKEKQLGEVETPFVPKISEVSRKLALRKTAEVVETKGVPHFMLHTKCKPPRELLEPIYPPPSKKSLEQPDPVDHIALDAPKSRRNIEVGDEKEKATLKLKLKNLDALTAMSKNDLISGPVVLDENVFTFHPKVSDTSNKIVENLGTDFMSRQQKHLEKQRKLLNQATSKQNYQTLFAGPLSPVSVGKSLSTRRYSERLEVAQDGGPLTLPGAVEGAQEPDEGSDEVSSSQTTASSISQLKPGASATAAGQENSKLHHRSRAVKDRLAKSQSAAADSVDMAEDKENDVLGSFAHMRSKTMPSLGRPKIQRKLSTVQEGDRLRLAKEQVERAIKYKKIFTIQGGYSTIRHLLRKRGWVEKFYKIQPPPKPTPRTKRRKNSDDDDDSDGADDVDDDDDDDADADDSKGDEQPKVPPWEEEDGIYGIMSRMVRNVNPTFIWVLKRDTIDYRYLSKDQIINHYCRAGSFTTKVGLCVNMRNVPWFENADPDTFYPRCYRLSHDEDKSAFIDDYRLAACMAVLKVAVRQMKEVHQQLKQEAEAEDRTGEAEGACTNPTCTRSRPNSKTGNKCVHAAGEQDAGQSESAGSAGATAAGTEAGGKDGDMAAAGAAAAEEAKSASAGKSKGKKRVGVPLRVVEFSVAQCEKFLGFRNHEDIDVQEEQINEPTEETWEKFLQQYYALAHDGGYIPYVPKDLLSQCENLVTRLRAKCPQFDLDGTRNVWIVKPGAKSRGRGIMCYDKLEEMLKLVSAQVVQKEGKYVVQKYIERPLLIYNTKFDIRQWFLVTDWNPLTLYFYQDSYLRFCSQEFTLDNFDESIHLSNNAIQKHYKNGPRSERLPTENMWTHVEFQDYLTSRKLGNLWEDVIYPGMKKAIICSLLATQDVIEYRKSSFELYGADFMLSEDFMPWIIEINSSPSMESSTAVTARLCAAVLEDTLKVVLDRRFDRNCDIGRFELAYKQPLVTVPPYIGISLSIDGQSVRKPTTNRPAFDITPRNAPRPSASLDKVLETKKGGGSYSGSASQSAHSGGAAKEDKLTRRSSKTPDNKVRFSMQTSKSCPEGRGDLEKRGAHEGGTLRSGNDGQSQGFHHRSGEAPNLHPIRSHSPREDRRSQGLSSASRSADGQDSIYSRDPDHLGRQAEGGARLKVPVPPPPKTLTTTPGAALQQVASRRIVSRTSVSSNYPVPPSIPDKNTKAPTMSVNNVESTDLQTIKPSKGFLNPLIAGAWGRTCNECGNGMNLHLSKLTPKCKCQRDSVIVRFDNVRIKSAAPSFAKKSRTVRAHRPPSAQLGDMEFHSMKHPRRSSAQSSSSMSKTPCKTFLNYTDGGIPRPDPPLRSQQVVVPAYSRVVRSLASLQSISFKYGPHLPQFMANSVYLDTSQLQNPLSIVPQGFR